MKVVEHATGYRKYVHRASHLYLDEYSGGSGLHVSPGERMFVLNNALVGFWMVWNPEEWLTYLFDRRHGSGFFRGKNSWTYGRQHCKVNTQEYNETRSWKRTVERKLKRKMAWLTKAPLRLVP